MVLTVTITGTGCPIPMPGRAGPGVLVTVDDLHLQFDAGRSTVLRLTEANSSPNRLDAVFVTHHHSDHLAGLPDLAMTRWVMDLSDDETQPLTVVAPQGPSCGFVERMLDPWDADFAVRMEHTGRKVPPRVDLQPFPYPEHPTEVWRSGDVSVKAGQVRHEPVHPAVGFRVDSPYGSVVITGDTLVCPEVAELAAEADVLVYEAMRFSLIRASGPQREFVMDYHADTQLIGAQAAELGVPNLILTHLIPPPRNEAEVQGFADDIRAAGYEGNLIVANDLDTLTLS